MALFDDAPAERPRAHTIGEDLATLSLDEIDIRIGLLEAEIERLRAAHAAKSASRDAAASFFKT